MRHLTLLQDIYNPRPDTMYQKQKKSISLHNPFAFWK